MTALEAWKSNPDDQKMTEVFFKSDAGQRLLAVLVERNALIPSSLPGMDGIHEDSKAVQRWEGWMKCLAFIPTLYATALRSQGSQQEARDKLAAERNMHRNVTAQNPTGI